MCRLRDSSIIAAISPPSARAWTLAGHCLQSHSGRNMVYGNNVWRSEMDVVGDCSRVLRGEASRLFARMRDGKWAVLQSEVVRWCPASRLAALSALESVARCATELELLRSYAIVKEKARAGDNTEAERLCGDSFRSSSCDLARRLATSCRAKSVAKTAALAWRARLEARLVTRWVEECKSNTDVASRLARYAVETALAGRGRWHVATLLCVAEPFLARADAELRGGRVGDEPYPEFLQVDDTLREATAHGATSPECFELARVWRRLVVDDAFFLTATTLTEPEVTDDEGDALLMAGAPLKGEEEELSINCRVLDAQEVDMASWAKQLEQRVARRHVRRQPRRLGLVTLASALDEPKVATRAACRRALDAQLAVVKPQLRLTAVQLHDALFAATSTGKPPAVESGPLAERRAYEKAADLWHRLSVAQNALSTDGNIHDLRATVIGHVLRALAFYVSSELREARDRLDADIAAAPSFDQAFAARRTYFFKAGIARATFATPLLARLRDYIDLLLRHAHAFLTDNPYHKSLHYRSFTVRAGFIDASFEHSCRR